MLPMREGASGAQVVVRGEEAVMGGPMHLGQ